MLGETAPDEALADAAAANQTAWMERIAEAPEAAREASCWLLLLR